MTDFTSVSIRPPKDWQAFERHSRLLFEYVLGDPATQNNGRPGQRQHGVDIFGRRGGGDGPLVGVQCKGKDGDYGAVVTEAELRREIKKTERFKPPLNEFILITTAPNDATIQEDARLLEQQLRLEGRELSISVWGWERVQQEINRYGEVLKAFHPDATPFTDRQLEAAERTRQDTAQIKEMLAQQSAGQNAFEERIYKLLDARTAATQISSADAPVTGDPIDKLLNDQVDTFRNLIRQHRPTTAITMLEALRQSAWSTASDKVRFRILANLGAAHHNLGAYDKAADFFLEAYAYNPNEPISIANYIAGLLIKNRRDEAEALANESLPKFPDSIDLALQRLQARAADEDIEQLWPELPAKTRERPELILFRAGALREADDARWRGVIDTSPVEPTDDDRVRALRAEATLDRIFSRDRSALGSAGSDVPDQTTIEQAAATLEAIWQQSLQRETPPNVSAAHNAALAYNILGRRQDATRLLDHVLQQSNVPEESKRLRLALYPRSTSRAEAMALADTLGDAPQSLVMRAELRMYDTPVAARSLLAARGGFTRKLDIVGASFLVVESYLQEGNFADALAEAERLKSRYPDDPQCDLTIYRVKKAAGDATAEEALAEAVSKIVDGTDFVTRFMAADELANVERWDDVIALLRGHVSTRFDSAALRALLASAANGDRREVLQSVLDALPTSVARLPFYRRSRIALSIRVQDIKRAETEIRAYLEEKPRDLEMHLQLMHALFRQDKLPELRAEAARPASAFDGDPRDVMKLAQFKDSFGDWKEAHALAYETLLKNFGDAEVNMAYTAVFFHPGHSQGLDVSPAEVGEDMAVGLKTDDGPLQAYVIEPNPALRPTPRYVAPDHPIARALMGKAVGDTIVLPDGVEAKIEWIKPKVLQALHEILENFQRQFPDVDGLERIPIDPQQGERGLAEVINRLRERQQAIEEVFNTYESSLFPIACAGRMLGKRTVDTFLALSSAGRTVKVCEGTSQERDAAFAAIRDNNCKGCVLDPVALHIVRRLGLDDAVTAVCGPMATVENRILRVTQDIFELEQNIDQPDLSLSWSDGQTYRHEVTPDEKRHALDVLKTDRDWMRTKLEVLPAQGASDPTPQVNELIARFGSGFLDEARAAQGSGRLFVCEDQGLRVLAMQAFGVAATWLQPVLMSARDKRHLTQEQYRKAIVALAEARLDFVSVDAPLLLGSIGKPTSLDLPRDFVKLSEKLGGAKADLGSHLKVAAETIVHTWRDESLPWTLRQAVVGKLLESVCRERPLDQVHLILVAFVQFNQNILKSAEFVDYLERWAYGHFIPLPKP